MIAELARRLVDEATEQINHHEAEIARLQLLRESIEAFMDQPEQGAIEGAAEPPERVGTPAPASQPGSDQPAGAIGTPVGEVGTPTPATAPAASSTEGLRCPDCDAGPFAKSQGLGRHRSWKHPESFVAKGDQRRHHNARPTIPPPATIHVEDPDEPPRRSERSTIAERIAARDAGRTATHLAGRNPRSTPPLDLPSRADGFPGE